MYQRRYDKAYLMLRQESSGYGIGHRAPWGSCTMEIKNGMGQLRLQVQGLIPLHSKGYTVYALAEKEQECHAICCGQLLIDKHGTGMLTWEFSADDLDGIYQVEDLFAITILTPSGDKMAAPLTAYFGTPRKWLSRLHLPQSTEQVDLIAAEAAVRPTVLLDAPEPPATKNKTALSFADREREVHTPTEQAKTETAETSSTSYHGNFRGLLQKFRQEMQDLTDMGILSEEESSRILGYRSKDAAVSSSNQTTIAQEQASTAKGENTDTLSQEMVSQDTSYDLMPAQETPLQECTCDTVPEQAILSEESTSDTASETEEQETASLPQPQNNPQSEQEQTRARAAALQNCTPEAEASPCPQDTFFAALEILRSRPAMTPFSDKCTWRCITLQDLVLFPAVPLYWQKEPFFLLTMAKYGHLLLRREGEHFLLGVPDTYTPENTPYAKQFGLSTFQKLDKEHPEGYWLGVLPEESRYK